MRTFVKDLRHGVRLLLKAPSFSAVVVLTLTLAIGANTLIFSIASFLLIRPLPFQDPDTIAFIYAVDPQRGTDRGAASYPDFVDWRDQSTSFERLAALREASYTLTGPVDPMRVSDEGSRPACSRRGASGRSPAVYFWNLLTSKWVEVQRTGTTCAVSPAHLSSSNNHRLSTLRRLLAAAEQAPQPERGLRRRPSTEARKHCSGRDPRRTRESSVYAPNRMTPGRSDKDLDPL